MCLHFAFSAEFPLAKELPSRLREMSNSEDYA